MNSFRTEIRNYKPPRVLFYLNFDGNGFCFVGTTVGRDSVELEIKVFECFSSINLRGKIACTSSWGFQLALIRDSRGIRLIIGA